VETITAAMDSSTTQINFAASIGYYLKLTGVTATELYASDSKTDVSTTKPFTAKQNSYWKAEAAYSFVNVAVSSVYQVQIFTISSVNRFGTLDLNVLTLYTTSSLTNLNSGEGDFSIANFDSGSSVLSLNVALTDLVATDANSATVGPWSIKQSASPIAALLDPTIAIYNADAGCMCEILSVALLCDSFSLTAGKVFYVGDIVMFTYITVVASIYENPTTVTKAMAATNSLIFYATTFYNDYKYVQV
jgi:hypothetical protein